MKRRATGRVVPGPVEVDALIDTGAEVTCVSTAVLQRLGPDVTTVIPTHSPALAGLVLSSQYKVDLVIFEPMAGATPFFSIADFSVTELDLSLASIDALLGRDFLSRFVFTYDGPADTFTLIY